MVQHLQAVYPSGPLLQPYKEAWFLNVSKFVQVLDKVIVSRMSNCLGSFAPIVAGSMAAMHEICIILMYWDFTVNFETVI